MIYRNAGEDCSTMTWFTVTMTTQRNRRHCALMRAWFISCSTNFHVWALLSYRSIKMYFTKSSDGLRKLMFCDGWDLGRGLALSPVKQNLHSTIVPFSVNVSRYILGRTDAMHTAGRVYRFFWHMHTASHARTYQWLYTRPITLPALTRWHHKH